MSTKNADEQLNRLLKRNYDAEEGYRQVAEKVEHPEFRAFLQNNSRQRYDFGHELKEMMKELHIKPDKGTSLTGDAHRVWINIRELLSMNSDKAILDEAERGEEIAMKDYIEAVENPNLAPGHKRKLSDHLNSIKSSHEQVRKLKATLR